MQKTTVGANAARHDHDDAGYRAFLSRIHSRFAQRTEDGARPMFLTDAEDLWAVYLDSFSDLTNRQYHD